MTSQAHGSEVLVAEEAAVMLLGPARIAVLLPQLGELLLPPCWCAASPQLVVLVTTVPLRRHGHDTGVNDLSATRDVAFRRKMLVKTLKSLWNGPRLRLMAKIAGGARFASEFVSVRDS